MTTMPDPNFAAFKWILKLLGAAPKLYEHVQQWRGQPSKEDRERLVRYCRRLDERRVFSAPFNSEIEEACIASLCEVKKYTDDALAEIEHPAARAAVGAILDEVRKVVDKWHGYRSSRRWSAPRHWDDPGSEQERDFFQDLGELRGRMRIFVGMLTELVPDAKAPRLLGEPDR